MRAMLLDAPRHSLRAAQIPRPEPGLGQILLAVQACGVCRTDLHVADGDPPLVAAGDAERLGLYGFGAAAHIVAQVARHQGRRVFAFTRAGDTTAQRFALELGAAWAGDSEAAPPEPLDAAIIYAPVGALVPSALR